MNVLTRAQAVRSGWRAGWTIAVVSVLVGCGGGSPAMMEGGPGPAPTSPPSVGAEAPSPYEEVSPSPAERTEAAFAATRGRLEMMAWDPAYSDILEALPNVEFQDGAEGRYRISDIAIVGTVVDVLVATAGGGEENGRGSEEAIPGGSNNALWRGFELVVRVDEVLSQARETGAIVQGELVSFLVPASPQLTIADVQGDYGQGPVVVLGRRDNVVEGRPDLFSIVGRGSFWLQIGADGSLSAPILRGLVEGRLVPEGLTIEEVRKSAAESRSLQPVWERQG